MNTLLEKILTDETARDLSVIDSANYDDGDGEYGPWAP